MTARRPAAHPPSHPSAAPPLARLTGAGKRYGRVTALAAIDLEVRAGEVLAVLGANGAGKSTALGLLTGRLGPDQGRAELFGRDPREPASRRGIGVMLQEATLPETLRVAELVRLFSGYYPAPRALPETLELAGLQSLASRRFDALSGGEKRRLQFALALCGNAPLLFIDEPSVGLDVEARRHMWQVLRALRDAGTTLVLTTHHLEEADALADRIVVLAEGRVLATDTAAGIKALAAGKRVRCRTSLPAARIAQWPEVDAVGAEGDRLELRTGRAEALLRRLLAADAGLADLEVLQLGLEDAFIALTAATSRANGGPSREQAA